MDGLSDSDFKDYYENLNSPINALVGSQRIDEKKKIITLNIWARPSFTALVDLVAVILINVMKNKNL